MEFKTTFHKKLHHSSKVLSHQESNLLTIPTKKHTKLEIKIANFILQKCEILK